MHRRTDWLRTLLILGAAFSPACDQRPAATDSKSAQELIERVDQKVPGWLEESLVPGAAVALIQNGEVIHIKGYGLADVSGAKPVTTRHGFNIGSISKTVAAWGVLKLVEEGRLDLDAPVSRYLTRWKLPDSEFDSGRVTLRRLLSHTAGLSLHGYPGFGPEDELPSPEASLSGATNGSEDVRLIMEPGTQWKYSGGGYTLAQLIVEEVSGQRFADYMRENVLHPLGMRNSDYELTPSILAASSLCYDGLGELTPNPRFTAQAAAGLHTTIEDFASFAAAGLSVPNGAKAGRGVLKPETVAEMMRPASASEGAYGLGYSVTELPGDRNSVGHGGSNRGWQAIFRILPDSGDGFAVTTNGSNGWFVHQQVACEWTEWLSGERPEEQCKKPAGLAVLHALLNKGPEAAETTFWKLKESGGDEYAFSEGQLNWMGYELLRNKRMDDALVLFKLNVAAYPEASNPYDSLGEAYAAKGDRELAILNYKKSLELDPKNDNARKWIEKLEKAR